MIEQTKRGTFRTRQKTEYNRKNYEQCKIWIRKGGREIIQQLAAAQGMSQAEYIRHLVIIDAAKRGIDVRAALGGGGVKAVTGTREGIDIKSLHQLIGDWARTITDQATKI